MAEVAGRPMIIQQIDRINRSRRIEKLTVATSTDASDDELCELLGSEGIVFHRGSLANVAERFAEVIRRHRPSHVVRLTADCPLADWEVIDLVIDSHLFAKVDYTSNTLERTFPKGLDVEIFRSDAFLRRYETGLDRDESEHVTLGLYDRVGDFSVHNVANRVNNGNLRWTVDYASDLEFVRDVYRQLWASNPYFTSENILALAANSAPEP